MARKSKRKAINWKVIVWTLFAANMLLGLMYSPMTSVRNIRIQGAQRHDEGRIGSLAQALRGRPFARVAAEQFESAIMRQRDVYHASLSHNLFGSAIAKVEYRRPVAVLLSMPHTYLDDQGVIFGSPEKMPDLRRIALAPEYVEPGVALALPWPSQSVAELCTKLDSFDQLKGAAVHLDTTGRLLIRREDKHTVDLGGTEQLDVKLAKLRGILDKDPELLNHVLSLSLADPNRPATKARQGS
jgi:hypothetical protein